MRCEKDARSLEVSGNAAGKRGVARELLVRERNGKLEERQRVAGGLVDQPRADRRRRTSRAVIEQQVGGCAIKAADDKVIQPGRVEAEQLSNVVDEKVVKHQAATFSSVVVVSSSVTLIPSLNFMPASTSLTSSWPLNRRQRSWAASRSL